MEYSSHKTETFSVLDGEFTLEASKTIFQEGDHEYNGKIWWTELPMGFISLRTNDAETLFRSISNARKNSTTK